MEMEKKELSFVIEGKNLYTEQCLVDYENVPIFFLCRSEQQLYLVLCTDYDELNYVIVELANEDVYKLLNEKIPMRDAILKQTHFWEVITGEEVTDDIVRRKSISEIDMASLPEEGACFEALTGSMKEFVEKFNCKYIYTTADTLNRNVIAESFTLVKETVASDLRMGDSYGIGTYTSFKINGTSDKRMSGWHSLGDNEDYAA